jgi:hypothetical protein
LGVFLKKFEIPREEVVVLTKVRLKGGGIGSVSQQPFFGVILPGIR